MEPTSKLGNAAAAAASEGLDIPALIENAGLLIYAAVAALGIWGAYNVILLYRSLAKKSLPHKEADELIGQVRDLVLVKNNPQAAIDLCLDPQHWHSALAQLMAVGLKNRSKGLAKVKQILVLDFHTEVISQMEARIGSIGTASRIGPLLGLVGTVMSMIAAFARMSSGSKPDPIALAGSISLGLWTTAVGLIIATPLMVIGNDALNRIRTLRDRTERQLQDFIEILEHAEAAQNTRTARAASTARAAAPR